MTTETQQGSATGRITPAWQAGAQALATGYSDQFRRLAELSAAFWQPRWLDRSEVREAVERITAGTRELAGAQAAVAGEWLRAPLWLTGAASPVDLQARYVRLFEAQRELVQAYIDAALGWQRVMTGAAEQVADVAREATDAQKRTARRVANDAREAQPATADTTRNAAETVRETAGRAAEQAQAVVNHAREVAKEAADQAEPAQRPVKGNINREGERIYHIPGQANYDRIDADMLFESEEQAQAAGFRPAQR